MNTNYCHEGLQRPVGDLEPKAPQSFTPQRDTTSMGRQPTVRESTILKNKLLKLHRGPNTSCKKNKKGSTIPQLSLETENQVAKTHYYVIASLLTGHQGESLFGHIPVGLAKLRHTLPW